MTKKFDHKYRPSTEHRFWLYDPEGEGLIFYRTVEERNEAAEVCLGHYCDDDAWALEVEGVCAGEVTHTTQMLNKILRPTDLESDNYDSEGNYWPPGVDSCGNYTLEPLADQQEKTR